jgi:hypothetical protein
MAQCPDDPFLLRPFYGRTLLSLDYQVPIALLVIQASSVCQRVPETVS